MPCTVRYVTTDCLHTQLRWGTKAKFAEVTQPAAKHYCLSGGKITGEKHQETTLYAKQTPRFASFRV